MSTSLVTRRSVSAGAAVFALTLGGVAVAWACSPFQPRVEVQGKGTGPQSSGPAGTELTFSGRDFAPGSDVEVRWNARTGKLLARALGPSFSVPITIPDDAAVGMHYIIAAPSVGNAASVAFEVTRSPSSSGEPPASSGGGATVAGSEEEEEATTANASQQTGSTGSTAGDTSATGQSTAASQTSDSTESGSRADTSGHSGSDAVRVTAPVQASNGSAPARSGASAASPIAGQAQAASANPAVVTTPAGQAVFGGSLAPAPAETPSTATVSGDTWSGFAGAIKPSLLAEDLAAPAPSAGSSSLGLGVAVLGAGLVALFAGFAAAEVARRRALAGVERS